MTNFSSLLYVHVKSDNVTLFNQLLRQCFNGLEYSSQAKLWGIATICWERIPPVLWASRGGRAASHFPLGPGWASKPLTPLGRGWTMGSLRYQGPWGDTLGPRGYRREGWGREVPTQARVCTEGLDEQRRSMVLELYYRKEGGKREGRKERETERQRETGYG